LTLNVFTFFPSWAYSARYCSLFQKSGTQCIVSHPTFFAIAGHYAYVLLNAQFLAAVHVIVYAGAIMVLFLYVIMLLNLNQETEPHKSNALKFAATICAGLLLLVRWDIEGTDQMIVASRAGEEVGLVKGLGRILFMTFCSLSKYLQCFYWPQWSGR